ncbi:MAG: hypothetical protein D3903_08440 [Candidatus Electrothrix sp. GM3_4]|nr:hypothetical protein [Candidatus Electrothrix sp. GM3_4]
MSNDNSKDSNKQNLIEIEQLVSVDRVSLNVSQSVIVTTEDKLRLSLGSYLKNVKLQSEWIAPLSLLIAILATLVTSTFNDFILSKDTWKGIFIIAGTGATIWLIYALLLLRNKSSVEDLIKEIKTGNQNDDSSGPGESI